MADDIKKLTEALRKEREEHRATREKLQAATAQASEHAALGENSNAVQMAEHIANATKANVARETVELQKKIATLETQLGEATAATESTNARLVSRSIEDEVRNAARESHVLPSAVNDLLSLGNLELKFVDGKVQTENGRGVAEWLDESKTTRPYMWPASRGVGARGSGAEGGIVFGDNPFVAGPSFNLTKQGQVMLSEPLRAERLKQEAAAMSRQ